MQLSHGSIAKNLLFNMHLISKGALTLFLFSIVGNSLPIDDPTVDPIDESVGGVDSISSTPDWFYKAPVGFEKAAPGSILRYRRVPRPISLTSITPILPKGAWQIQYRTQNSLGEPEASIVTVLEPFNAKRGNLFAQGFFVVGITALFSSGLFLTIVRRILLMQGRSVSVTEAFNRSSLIY
jgi:hypothetical protein